MAKIKTIFECQSCGHSTGKWMGKCPECDQWNSFIEIETDSRRQTIAPKSNKGNEPKKVDEIEEEYYQRYKTNILEFDRVVGGGATKGSLTLIGGEPGVGKSTLLLEVCGKLSKLKNGKVLYVSGEESEGQVASRAKRLGIDKENFYILNETSWQEIKAQIKKVRPTFFVLDSIQTTVSQELQSATGSVSQIREVTYELMSYAKANDITCFIVGHITKEGSIAGPKILEHMVDTVLYFEGDKMGQYRLLRTMKNRFGSTHEVGIFEMIDKGLKEVSNPSLFFIDENMGKSFGRSITCILEGARPIFLEIQALVVENKFSNPRKTTQGIDLNRLSLLVAVIDKYFEIPVSFNDIYLNVVGGMKLTTRESDLSIVASILSSFYSKALPNDTVFIGEVGLTGEVRPVPMLEQRLKEVEQMSYKQVITSYRNLDKVKEKTPLNVIGLKNAAEIKKLYFE